MNAFSDRLSGDITYSFFFTPKSPTGEKIARSPDLLREKVPAGFKSYLFYDDPSAAEEPVFRDLSTSESFLYSDGLPFPCTRVMLKDAELTTDAVKVSGSSVILTYCHDINIMHLAVSFAFTDADTDSLIYMHHMPTNGVPFRDGNGGEASLADMFKSTVKKLGLSFEEKELVISYSIELNEAYGYDDPELLTSEQSQRLYGILSGDEGYRHVPESLSSERVKTRWSSRDFARLIIFGSNFITLNLNRGERFGHYLKYQERFGSRFYGGLNPYFDLHSSVAGVNHGVFFAIETGMLIRTIADRTMTHHEEYQREHNAHVR